MKRVTSNISGEIYVKYNFGSTVNSNNANTVQGLKNISYFMTASVQKMVFCFHLEHALNTMTTIKMYTHMILYIYNVLGCIFGTVFVF